VENLTALCTALAEAGMKVFKRTTDYDEDAKKLNLSYFAFQTPISFKLEKCGKSFPALRIFEFPLGKSKVRESLNLKRIKGK